MKHENDLEVNQMLADQVNRLSSSPSTCVVFTDENGDRLIKSFSSVNVLSAAGEERTNVLGSDIIEHFKLTDTKAIEDIESSLQCVFIAAVVFDAIASAFKKKEKTIVELENIEFTIFEDDDGNECLDYVAYGYW